MTSPKIDTVLFRPMTAADIGHALKLTRDLGWPHRGEDWAFLLSLGEGIVAEVDGQVEGTVLAAANL